MPSRLKAEVFGTPNPDLQPSSFMSRLSRFSRQSRLSRLNALTAYQRCVIPTTLAHRLGSFLQQAGNAPIPYDNLPVLDHALLSIIQIAE